jgi:hypothetical protein
MRVSGFEALWFKLCWCVCLGMRTDVLVVLLVCVVAGGYVPPPWGPPPPGAYPGYQQGPPAPYGEKDTVETHRTHAAATVW